MEIMKFKNQFLLVAFSTFSLSVLADATNTSSPASYNGSSFTEVWNVITGQDQFIPKDQQGLTEYTVYSNGNLPQYPVTNESIFSKDKAELERDARRTLNSQFDYYDRIPKKLHPNGVCVSGEWNIFAPSSYSGYFLMGSKGLFIGRISAAMGETQTGKKRGFGFAGKIFPTLNPDQVVTPANFFTVDVLLGTKEPRVLQINTTNQPAIGFDLSLFGLLLKVSSALSKTGQNPAFRPLNQIGNLQLTSGQAKYPKWMRLSVAHDLLKLNDEKDFRNEVLKAMEENIEIKYNIEVSESTSDRLSNDGWNKLGEITLNKAIVSYGCDRRLHFGHPSEK